MARIVLFLVLGLIQGVAFAQSELTVYSSFKLSAAKLLEQNSGNLEEGLKYPFEWEYDSEERKQLVANKVKSITNSYFSSSFDTEGRITNTKGIERFEFANYTFLGGVSEQFLYDSSGNLRERTTSRVDSKIVEKRTFNYEGDTLLSSWWNNGKLMGLGLSLANLYVDYNVLNNKYLVYIYKKDKNRDGYTVLALTKDNQQLTELNRYVFKAENRLIESGSPDFKEKFEYDNNGLVYKKYTVVKNYTTKIIHYIRNEKGLLTKFKILTPPFDRRGNSKNINEVVNHYEYY